MLILALALTAAEPMPLTEVHQRDIGCVAVIGIIAYEQREGKSALQDYPDVRESGKRWAGLVGDRITFETGQPREVVGFVIQQAVQAEQAEAIKAADPAAYVKMRFAECKAIMDTPLAAKARTNEPVAVIEEAVSAVAEPDWRTDEPQLVALYRGQLHQDLSDRLRIAYCAGKIWSSHREVSEREGNDSRDAIALGRLANAFDAKISNLPGKDPGAAAAVEYLKRLQATESSEEQMARCMRLGESLALAMLPE